MRKLLSLFILPILFLVCNTVYAQIPGWNVFPPPGMTYNYLTGAFTVNGVNVTTGVQRVIGSLRGANMNITTDQAINIPTMITKWAPTGIWATNCTGGSLALAVGGIYTAASKSGTTLISALQAYSSLSTSTIILPMTLAGAVATTVFSVNTVYFSLSSASNVANTTCDIYVIAVDLT